MELPVSSRTSELSEVMLGGRSPVGDRSGELGGRNGCKDLLGKDSILGQPSEAGDSKDGDFKVPMNPQPNMLISPPARVQPSHLEVNEELPQTTTPERQLVTSTEVSNQEVRKRSILDSPAAGVEDPKRRNVSKTLDFGTESELDSALAIWKMSCRSGAARCIFGKPSEKDNEFVMREFEQRVTEDYARFTKRYVIVGDDGEDLVPSPYYTN